MSEVKVGIKETKEAVIGFISLAVMLAGVFKDGVQASDIAVIFAKIQGDEELKNKLIDAYNNIDQVPGEAKDIDLAEGVELVIAILPEIRKLMDAINAPKAA